MLYNILEKKKCFLAIRGTAMDGVTSRTEKIDAIVESSPQMSQEGKDELYLYSLRMMAAANVNTEKSTLTKLPNLKAFFYLCGEMMLEYPDLRYGVLVMDIVNFKSVNEFCGRNAGDDLLKFIANILKSYVKTRPHTYATHIRADIFALCTAIGSEQDMVDIVQDIRMQIYDYPFAYRVLPFFGISCSEPGTTTPISYLKDCATVAMNSIKGKHFSYYKMFNKEMRVQLLREKQVENDMIAALENDELRLYIQPKVDMRTGEVIGGEALVRWLHPERGLIPPGEFVDVLEKNGFIINVDKRVWEMVFQYLAKLREEGRKMIPISINVSRIHAYDKEFSETLTNLSEKYQVPPNLIYLELTESAFLEDEDGMYQRLEQLREKGFQISMDDFGTGYSTMNMLKFHDMDEVKIDRTLISDMKDKRSMVIISHMIQMLKELEQNIMIEGVETEEQRQFLIECGCEKAQGFYFYRPMPVEEFDMLLP